MDSKIERANWRNLLPGSMVKTFVRSPAIGDHFGILDKNLRVVSLGGESRIRNQTIAEFAGPYDIFLVEAPKCELQQREIFRRIADLPSHARYHFFEWNCEHAARWCFSGVAASRQLAAAGALAIGFSFAADMMSKGKLSEWIFVAAIAGGLFLFVKGTPIPEDQIVTTT